MNYYEVLVASHKFHGQSALTYASNENISLGSIVIVPMQRQRIPGVISRVVQKPAFKTKEILSVIDMPAVPSELLQLITWLKDYYPAPFGQLMTLVLPSSLVQKSRNLAEVTDRKIRIELPALTPEQKLVVSAMLDSNERMHLLHGETGTGKTRVYQELIGHAQKEGKNTLLLTPEIGLTSQLAQSIEDAFPGSVVILHSNLTPAQRRNRWLAIANSSKPLVVIGPRSALFAPLHTLGYIILDEAHDTAYKQEQSPHYVATRVAARLAEFHNAKVVLGTATPLISDYYTFEKKGLPIHRMTSLAIETNYNSDIVVINLRDSDSFTRSRWISNQVIKEIEANLRQGNQSLLFLNRRGSARIILCQSCGWHAACPNCDVTLTYHADTHTMRCHTCGHTSTAPSSCPECNATDITFKSAGTKTIATELEKLFPKANILRLDGDNTKLEKLENSYEAIKSGEVQIIIGTQVIAKGLDLPKLALVAVLLADSGLNFPDYTAEERTYQLLSQVLGRANRGHRDTKAIVQTFNPESPTITLAIKRDYKTFYLQQVKERELFGFPPFRYLLKLEVERASSKAAEAAAYKLLPLIGQYGNRITATIPAPAFIEKAQNKYRWHIIVRSNQRTLLTELIKTLPAQVHFDIDPVNLL